MANTWQGEFPLENLELDGYIGTSPVGRYPPNGYGLVDMIGNVWEWTVDWYQAYASWPTPAARRPTPAAATARAAATHATGPPSPAG
jgi:formylglycine-generating enzyme required for sulfatase activity